MGTPASPQEREALAPYLAGAVADGRGEVEAFCPCHPDTKRSASINLEKGVWYCHAGCGGGSIRQLVNAEDGWVSMDGRVGLQHVAVRPTRGLVQPTPDDVHHWHRRLRREPQLRKRLYRQRGISRETVRQAVLGWDGRAITIPVWTPKRRLRNVRRYDLNPAGTRSKIWNTRGMGDAALYPIGPLTRAAVGDEVMILEGEWDTLLALQHGHLAVTRTDGAGKPWHQEWTDWFVGLRVYLCHDLDRAGTKDDAETADAIGEVALSVHQCHLPFTYKESGGNDLTDYLLLQDPGERMDAVADLKINATPRS